MRRAPERRGRLRPVILSGVQQRPHLGGPPSLYRASGPTQIGSTSAGAARPALSAGQAPARGSVWHVQHMPPNLVPWVWRNVMSRKLCVPGAAPARSRRPPLLALAALAPAFIASPASASEADLRLPDLASVSFFGIDGHNLLLFGLLFCIAGMLFGLVNYVQLKNLPVHRSMREISELIFETCKTYLINQGKFIMVLWVFIGAVMVFYFGWLSHFTAAKVATIVAFSLVGIAGGIFTKIADIGSDLMKIVFIISEDDARKLGALADCTGANAGDSVGPTADGFETYGVTGVALITFILLAVKDPGVQVQLLVWIFVMRVLMILTSGVSYVLNEAVARARFAKADDMNFETPLTSLVWLTSILSMAVTYAISYLLVPSLGGDTSLWWKLSTIISCGTLAGALIPELVKVFTSTESGHVREVVTASREGGASLNILSGFIAGNFSAYWMGLTIVALMGLGYAVSTLGLSGLMIAPAVFSFGLVAFGFLGMGPVTIAVDSYGPVTDNAQSVYELSTIETLPGIHQELQKEFGFTPEFERAKHHLEANDGAGNTFKATAKPVLIGTAVVGATTLIFSIIMVLTKGLQPELVANLSLMHPPFLLGLVTGGAIIYWFTGASCQAVTTGAYRAVEFIKRNIKLDAGAEKASIADSKKVVAICTTYAQKGMFNIYLTVFFSTLAFACLEPYFFIGYLISIAISGLYQAIFMADAGGAWDNAKKVVEVELQEKGTPLHAATVVGDTVGDPFKDTSSVAMNPIIKFTTLFGLLAATLAITLPRSQSAILAVVFFLISTVFVWRSFYAMRIGSTHKG